MHLEVSLQLYKSTKMYFEVSLQLYKDTKK